MTHTPGVRVDISLKDFYSLVKEAFLNHAYVNYIPESQSLHLQTRELEAWLHYRLRVTGALREEK